MRAEIVQRFESNIARVRNLVALYTALGGPGQGRRPLHAADILRSSVVLLHASMEDVLRSVGVWRLPYQSEAVVNEIPLIGTGQGGRPEKFFLGKLVPHRTKTVQALVTESVAAYMNAFGVNNTTDIASFMRSVGFDPATIAGELPELDELIRRRHHIVHQADRNEQTGIGQHRARTISVEQVESWAGSVERSMRSFLENVPDDLL